MHIYIDGQQYNVSMTWHKDDTIDHFVEIDGEHHLLEGAHMVLDLSSEDKITHQELRERIEHEIRKKLDDLSGNGRS
jgi:polyhydroxyalkanoate synthesis regulator phasin